MKGLDVMVLEAGNADESHPELRKLASDGSWVASQRMDGRDAVDKHRQNERGQISHQDAGQRAEESVLSGTGAGKQGEQDGGCEKDGGMDADVVRLVPAEHLVR